MSPSNGSTPTGRGPGDPDGDRVDQVTSDADPSTGDSTAADDVTTAESSTTAEATAAGVETDAVAAGTGRRRSRGARAVGAVAGKGDRADGGAKGDDVAAVGTTKTPVVPPKAKPKASKTTTRTPRIPRAERVKAPSSRRWVPPTFITVGLLGVAWLITYYVAGEYVPFMTDLGNWNILIGMGGMAAAFGIATLWT